ncbi:condensation domain-containing protein [Actinacidiphila reveromycinica]|uniref:condensation domain-containing protein n=1 Tax=Actinacidiphila reveromycinica TaxID=659352 RepID=UPI0019209451|nr:condensation domain-containing protein [Streptomyces sp. SN-593]
MPLTLEQRMGLSPYKLKRWVLTHGWRVRGPLDTGRLRDALAEVTQRHEALRMRLRDDDGEVGQVFPPWEPASAVLHVREIAPEELDGAVSQVRAAELDPFREPPLRATVLRAGPDDHVLLLTVHHMAWDAWSGGLLWKGLWHAYRRERQAPPAHLPPSPGRYAVRAAEQAASGPVLTGEQAAYWRAVAGREPVLWPPAGTAPPLPQASDGWGGAEIEAARPDAGFPRRLAEFARAARVTSASAVTALCLAALARAFDTPSVRACYQYHGRDTAADWDVIGMYCRRFLVRADLGPEVTWGELARRTQQGLVDGAARSAAPFTLPRLRRLLEAEDAAAATATDGSAEGPGGGSPEAGGTGAEGSGAAGPGAEPAPARHPAVSPVTINIVPGAMRGGPGSGPPPDLEVGPLAGGGPGRERQARYRGQLWVIVTSDPAPAFYVHQDRTVVEDRAVAALCRCLAEGAARLDAAAAERPVADLLGAAPSR